MTSTTLLSRQPVSRFQPEAQSSVRSVSSCSNCFYTSPTGCGCRRRHPQIWEPFLHHFCTDFCGFILQDRCNATTYDQELHHGCSLPAGTGARETRELRESSL